MQSQSQPLGLYLHIPFCSQKCGYCDFYSVAADATTMDTYLNAITQSLVSWKKQLGARQADTLYLGGGTPILLGATRLCALLKACAQNFGLTPSAEITLEANPNHADYDTLLALRRAGYNRLSFGVQSAKDHELRALTRTHTAAQAREAIVAARRAGFENINADLMLAIPHQTMQSMRESARFLADTGVTHISAYLLKLEEGTSFFSRKDALSLPDEDLTADLYLGAAKELDRLGYRQYEISNFARDGFACRHNLVYWDSREYLGIGPAAHSFLGGKRLAYPRDLSRFLEGGEPEAVDDGGDFEEYAMLRLRLNEGLVFAAARERYGSVDEDGLRRRAQALVKQGLCECDKTGIRLTVTGFLFSNTCIGRLLA